MNSKKYHREDVMVYFKIPDYKIDKTAFIVSCPYSLEELQRSPRKKIDNGAFQWACAAMIIFWLSGDSYEYIGRQLGRDHSTVVRQVRNLIEDMKEPQFDLFFGMPVFKEFINENVGGLTPNNESDKEVRSLEILQNKLNRMYYASMG